VTADSEIVPGQVLVNKYRLTRLLGRGGMGVVFAAKHLLLGERVAIKVLTSSVRQNPEALRRLQREARILARLRNEHVVRVLDLGELENGAPFVVMEYLAGCDLGSLLEKEGRLAPERAVEFALQTTVALAAAHGSGVVHRDLKPENLYRVDREDGTFILKVLDFGVSRLERASEEDFLRSSVTRTNAVVGTPLYMSPEQLRNSKGVDARSDIWSLGVVLYELLAGVPPFVGESFGDVAIKIATESPRPLSDFVSTIDPALAAVVIRCLEKDRESRFQNVGELARALLPFAAAGYGQAIDRIDHLLLRSAADSDSVDEAWRVDSTEGDRSELPATSRGRLRARIGLALGAAALGVLLLAWRFTESPSEEPRASTRSSFSAGASAIPLPPAPLAVRSAPDESGLPPATNATREDPAVAAQSPRIAATSGVERTRRPRNTAVTPQRDRSCDPPYTIDPEGRKRFRHECFLDANIR